MAHSVIVADLYLLCDFMTVQVTISACLSLYIIIVFLYFLLLLSVST